MRFLTRNNVRTVLSESITDSDNVIYIDKVDATSPYRNPPVPDISNGELLHLTIASSPTPDDPFNKIEIVSVTNMITDPGDAQRWELTVTRGDDLNDSSKNSSQQSYSFDAGSLVYLANTAASIDAKLNIEIIRTDVDGTSNSNGDYETVVTPNSADDNVILYSFKKYNL